MTADSTIPNRRLRVFLCYAHEDREAVLTLYKRLQSDGFQPWMDEEDLLPGQEWQTEIRKAVRSSDAFLVCLSPRSTTRAGFVHKEIAFALDIAGEQPEGSIFVIPLKLEPCTAPEKLGRWHWGLLFRENGYRKLVKSLHHRAEQLGLQPATDKPSGSGVSPVGSEASHPPITPLPHDVFARYESALDIAKERLGKNHARYQELLTYEQRLRENIAHTKQFGDTETRKAERAEVIARLNSLTTDTLDVPFNELPRWEQPPVVW